MSQPLNDRQHMPETDPTGVGTQQQRIYAWLGFWRDHMPPEAVCALQDILGPLDVKVEAAAKP